MSKRVLIIGGSSAIAISVARRYAADGARIGLIARRAEAIRSLQADLKVRGATEVEGWVVDATDIEGQAKVLDEAWTRFDGIDHLLVAFGVLPDQSVCQTNVSVALSSFDVNARSVIAALTDVANRFERQGRGVIGVIASPAGVRGRASNYVYGAAKASVINFCSGLRQRLASRGVRVVTILPGFVDTPMTRNFSKGMLWAQPSSVGSDIYSAMNKGAHYCYTPWFWRYINFAVNCIPEEIFIRLKL
jgi:decaprenylphospho-beta-D-erythro-pentofuranosid-2-ulose 2-reductase